MEGPKIIFTIPLLGGIPVTETVVNSWLIIVAVFIICRLLTRNLQKIPKGGQILAEKYVSMICNLVDNTMGKNKQRYAPYIGTLFLFSAFGSLISLLGLRPITADLNTTLAWALVTFMMTQLGGIRTKGFVGWLKGFLDPVPIMLPMNIMSEIVNPISMSFRHFGNISAGLVITSLVYSGLAALTNIVFQGLLPVPIFQLGLPAVLSIYFDLFSGVLQAFIFCMLTMVFVGMATDP